MDRQSFNRLVDEERRGRARVLERAYPLVKEAAELLEQEDPGFGRTATRLRQDIGAELARLGRPSPEFR